MSESDKNKMNNPSAAKPTRLGEADLMKQWMSLSLALLHLSTLTSASTARDIQGSIAHAKMLCAAGVLTADELEQIVSGLQEIEAQIESGEFNWSVPLEDVHMNIEAALTEKIGIIGKKLHTGRSRNDQVATDIKLWLRDQIDQIAPILTRLQRGMVELAAAEANTIMPGFTHLQTAQPVTFGHHLLAWNEMLSATTVVCRIVASASTRAPWVLRPWPEPPILSIGSLPPLPSPSTSRQRIPWIR